MEQFSVWEPYMSLQTTMSNCIPVRVKKGEWQHSANNKKDLSPGGEKQLLLFLIFKNEPGRRNMASQGQLA